MAFFAAVFFLVAEDAAMRLTFFPTGIPTGPFVLP
jgi:hypothetical protein